jgi:hypothetical protein
MATIEIADNDARVQYTQAVTASTTQLTIDFPFFDLDDINVIVTTAAGVDTTLSRGTGTGTFSVTGTAVDDGFSGGYVTLGDSYSAGTDTFTILRDIPVARTTDFPTSGPFNISSLNTELDKIIAIEQEIETKVSRTMKLADSDSAASITLPSSATRANKFLSFDANGAVTVSTTIGDYKGADATTTTAAYVKHDIIKSTTAAQLNNIYICIADSAIGDLLTDTTHFELIVDAVSAATSAANAATSETNAGISETNAGDSETNAATSESNAQDWAVKTNGIVDSTDYSSKAWSIGGTGVTDTSGAGPAKDWAVETTGTVDGTEYSAKEYAIGSLSANTSGSAKQWALGGGGSYASTTAVDGSNFSARYWAEKAQSYVQQDFQNTYLGAHSSDPTQDPYDADPSDSQALEAGDLYFNTANNVIRVYDGANWNDAVQDTTGFASNGFSIAMAIAL